RAGEELLRSGNFNGWTPTMLLGMELRGKTLGIAGFGRIGQAVAERAHGFGMKIVVYNRSKVQADVLERFAAKQLHWDAFLAEVDVLSLHVPHNPETENLLNEASLRALKKGALVINTARGAVLNEDAAAKLLHDGHLGGLALDVYRDE